MEKTHNKILHVILFCITGIFLFSSCATVPGPEGEIIIPAQWGYFTDPASFATDSDGNYYVVAREINCVQKFTKKGDFKYNLGEKGSKIIEFSSPESIAIDKKGNVYVVDTGNARVCKFNKDDELICVFKCKKNGEGIFKKPKNIYIVKNEIYVTDIENHCIRKLNADCTADVQPLLKIQGNIPPKTATTKFDVSKNGFKFANTKTMGLCVGMCFAALDLFCAGYDVPESNSIEKIMETPFGRYLNNRQNKRFPPEVQDKINSIKTMDDKTISSLISEEFQELRYRLDKGYPTSLIIIYSEDLKLSNHMVLAVGYKYNEHDDSKSDTIYLYDPNFPQYRQWITLQKAEKENEKVKIIKPELQGYSVRCFFISDYDPNEDFPKDGLKHCCPRL